MVRVRWLGLGLVLVLGLCLRVGPVPNGVAGLAFERLIFFCFEDRRRRRLVRIARLSRSGTGGVTFPRYPFVLGVCLGVCAFARAVQVALLVARPPVSGESAVRFCQTELRAVVGVPHRVYRPAIQISGITSRAANRVLAELFPPKHRVWLGLGLGLGLD